MITRTLWDVVCTTQTGGRECEAEANALPSKASADAWRDRHHRETGHTHYLRIQADNEDLTRRVKPPERVRSGLRAVEDPKTQ
ncbi:hypothetical protein [Streptomyces sulphureus]|uniref:hypothetical protein n=1 Tax=Streptomyces sulphureus TaxID=47758 RepID=UPI000380CC53|nr:hypothetical protein [Streptomyces sulphureus]